MCAIYNEYIHQTLKITIKRKKYSHLRTDCIALRLRWAQHGPQGWVPAGPLDPPHQSPPSSHPIYQIGLFISYDNATKQLDMVYDITPELAQAFLERIRCSSFDVRNISTIHRQGWPWALPIFGLRAGETAQLVKCLANESEGKLESPAPRQEARCVSMCL